jgi:hypothetical protein
MIKSIYNKISELLFFLIEPLFYPLRYFIPLLVFLIFYGATSIAIENIFRIYTIEKGVVLGYYQGYEENDGNSTESFLLKGFDNEEHVFSVAVESKTAVGDTIEFRKYRNGDIMAFSKNGNPINGFYDFLVFIAAIVAFFIGWIYLKFYILPFYQKYFKKHDKI